MLNVHIDYIEPLPPKCSAGPSWKSRKQTSINQSICCQSTPAADRINLWGICNMRQGIGEWDCNWEIRWWEVGHMWQQRACSQGQRRRAPGSSLMLSRQKPLPCFIPPPLKNSDSGINPAAGTKRKLKEKKKKKQTHIIMDTLTSYLKQYGGKSI